MDNLPQTTIRSIEDLQTVINKINRDIDAAEKEMNLRAFLFNMKPIELKITGREYDSTIGTTVMKSILSLQEEIYNIYKLAEYGTLKAKLDQSEKNSLEVFVKVEPGCSLINVDGNEVAKKVIDMISDKLTGTQIAVVLIVFVGLFAAYKFFSKKTDADKVIKLETARLAHDEKMSEINRETIKDLVQVIDTTSKHSAEALKALAGIKADVEINGKHYDKRELLEAAEVNEEFAKPIVDDEEEDDDLYQESIKGRFIVDKIKVPRNKTFEKKDSVILSLIDTITGKQYTARLSKENFSTIQSDMFLEGLKGEVLDLEMTVTYQKDKILGCMITKFKDNEVSEEQPGLF